MNRRVRIAAVLIAGFVAAVGLVLLVGPVKVTDARAGGIACGSVVSPDSEGPDPGAPALEVAEYERLHGECTDRLGVQGAVAWPLLGVGVAGLVGVAVVSARRKAVYHQ